MVLIKFRERVGVMYKNKKIFVLGMARSGYEVAKLLAKDNNVFITDMKEQDKEKVSELESQTVEVRTVSIPMKFTKEALLALEDELKKNETGVRISSVTIADYTFAYVTEIPEDKGYSEGNVTFTFYTMQKIQKPDFSK